jgi:glycosyltransferase involved in cell wall biosynthesis
MKIVLFNTLYYPHILGGAERSTQILAETLNKKGFDVVVISTGNKDEEDIVNGVKVYYINIPNIFWRYEAHKQGIINRSLWRAIDYYNFFTGPRVKKILLKEKPDICHTNNIGGFSISLWDSIKQLNIPLVHTIRDYYSICATSKMLRNDKSCAKRCFSCKIYTYNKKIISQKVDAVIGVSKFILDIHLKNGYFTTSKIKNYIYNPIERIDTNFIKQNNHNLVFGYLGLISSIKGVELLLRSFQKIKNKNIYLILAGKENNPNYIDSLKEKYLDDRVRFIGFVEPEFFFSKIDVLIHPALWHEPFGRVVAESYNYGIPVVSSRNGGLIEIIDNKKTGFLFTTEKDLIDKINYFIDNRDVINDMRAHCLNKAKSLFADRITDQYIEVYNNLQ